jgi:hypothetical protein
MLNDKIKVKNKIKVCQIPLNGTYRWHLVTRINIKDNSISGSQIPDY